MHVDIVSRTTRMSHDANSDDDRFIENMTACEKLCFMLLDQQKRLEDKLDELVSRQEITERWSIYHAFINNCWSQKYQYETQFNRSLGLILEKLSEERTYHIINECLRPIGIADIWDSIYYNEKNKKYKTIDYKRLRELIGDNTTYERLINNREFYDLPRRIWSCLTMKEVRNYLQYAT